MNQVIYKRSLVVSMLHLFVGFLFGLSVFIFVVMLLGPIFGLTFSEVNDWPFKISMMTKNFIEMNQVISPIQVLNSTGLSIDGGSLSFSTDYWPYYSLVGIVFKLLNIVWLMAFFYNFRHIIASVEYGKPFTAINYKRLNYLAILLVFWFIYGLLYSAVHHWYIMNYFELINGEFISNVFDVFIPNHYERLTAEQIYLETQYSTRPLFGAMFIYSLALVYKEGLRIKQDGEAII